MATLVGSANSVSWGISAQTGGIAQVYSESSTCDKIEIKNIFGDIVGVSYNGQKIIANVVFLTGSGISQDLGTSIVIQNKLTSENLYLDNFTIVKSNEAFQTTSVNATAYPSI